MEIFSVLFGSGIPDGGDHLPTSYRVGGGGAGGGGGGGDVEGLF
jgi:hypothetical protein